MLRITLFFICLLFTLNSFAQLKPHIGINFPSLTSPPLGRDVESNNGFIIGVSYKYGKRFYFEPGLQYATFGHKLTKTLDSEEYIEINSMSIRVPVMFGGNFMDKDALVNIRAFTGPSMTFAFTEDIDFGNLKVDERNQILWGWNVGYGIDIWYLYLEVGYEFGLSNYFSTHEYDTRKANQNMLWITLGSNLLKGKN